MKKTYTIHMRGNGPLSVDPFDSMEEAERYCEEHNAELLFPDDLMIVEAEVKTWEDFLPNCVSLYNVDYRSNLDDHKAILQKCIATNAFYPITEKIDEWWDFPERYYLKEMEKAMREEGMEDEYEEHYDEIREKLWELDESDPVKDLLRNTTPLACFYDLGKWMRDPNESEFFSSSELRKSQVLELCKYFGIHKGDKSVNGLKEAVDWNSYGGHLRIYFPADWEKLVNHKEKDEDYKTIRFEGTFPVAIINNSNGSGGYGEVEMDIKLPFNRENIFLSKCGDGYSLEDIYGHYDDWARNYSEPEFSFEAESDKELGKSTTGATIEREYRLDLAYRQGKCTLGDTNMGRHRDVFYKNEYPCGWHCPHCGQFWID